MKTIILCAGRGSRLSPLTKNTPKCLLPIGETTVLGKQLEVLRQNGLRDVYLVTGFKSELVALEAMNHARDGMNVQTIFNPFFEVADNLASCWIARHVMCDDFLLLNGDTLFESNLLREVLGSRKTDIQITIDKKIKYDWDDMKVTLDGRRLLAIGKDLRAHKSDGESIGMLRFMGAGVSKFKSALSDLMQTSDGTKAWFLSAIDQIAKSDFEVTTFSIEGSKWAELDTISDYEICRAMFGTFAEQQEIANIAAVA